MPDPCGNGLGQRKSSAVLTVPVDRERGATAMNVSPTKRVAESVPTRQTRSKSTHTPRPVCRSTDRVAVRVLNVPMASPRRIPNLASSPLILDAFSASSFYPRMTISPSSVSAVRQGRCDMRRPLFRCGSYQRHPASRQSDIVLIPSAVGIYRPMGYAQPLVCELRRQSCPRPLSSWRFEDERPRSG
jgi:hypothetical protein